MEVASKTLSWGRRAEGQAARAGGRGVRGRHAKGSERRQSLQSARARGQRALSHLPVAALQKVVALLHAGAQEVHHGQLQLPKGLHHGV